MARTGTAILVALVAALLGSLIASQKFKVEATVKATALLMDVSSRVVVNSAAALIRNSKAEGAAVGQDVIYGQVADLEVVACEMYSDPAIGVHTLLDSGNGDQNMALPPLQALPSWLRDISSAADKERHAGKAAPSMSRLQVPSVVRMQLPSQKLGATIAKVQESAHTQARSCSSPTKDPVGNSLFKLRSSQLATQSLMVFLGVTVANSAVVGVIFLLAGTGINADMVSTGKQEKDADNIISPSLLKQFFLAPVFLLLLAEVFRRNGGAAVFVLAGAERVRHLVCRLVRFGLRLF